MMEPTDANEQSPPADAAVDLDQQLPPFAPFYTLVNNTTTSTTHHPHVHYVFSDDDPDILTQALAQQHDANIHESSSNPAISNRAIILDIDPEAEAGYNVSWASSLSPSWAVLGAQLSRISPPSSESEVGTGAGEGSKKPDRYMLRIEGVDSSAAGPGGESKSSGERSSGSLGATSGNGSGQRDGDDYSTLVEEFEKKMTMLRKVVDAGEARRRKVAVESGPAELAELSAQPTDVPAAPE